jgi:hypothetical protein
VASWTRGEPRADRHAHCLACGGRMEPALLHTGSLRCLECRELARSLDPSLVQAEQWRAPMSSLARALLRRLGQHAPRRAG